MELARSRAPSKKTSTPPRAVIASDPWSKRISSAMSEAGAPWATAGWAGARHAVPASSAAAVARRARPMISVPLPIFRMQQDAHGKQDRRHRRRPRDEGGGQLPAFPENFGEIADKIHPKTEQNRRKHHDSGAPEAGVPHGEARADQDHGRQHQRIGKLHLQPDAVLD